MEIFYVSIVVLIIYMYIFVRTHWTLYLEWVHFIIHISYLNKDVKNRKKICRDKLIPGCVCVWFTSMWTRTKMVLSIIVVIPCPLYLNFSPNLSLFFLPCPQTWLPTVISESFEGKMKAVSRTTFVRWVFPSVCLLGLFLWVSQCITALSGNR